MSFCFLSALLTSLLPFLDSFSVYYKAYELDDLLTPFFLMGVVRIYYTLVYSVIY